MLGGRASAEQVRPGASEAEIEALFDVSGGDCLAAQLDAAGVSHDGELPPSAGLCIHRPIARAPNGRLCTAGELAALAPELADVASQHESVALTDPATHLGYLDRFARLVDQRAELAALVTDLEEIVAKIRAARDAERGRGEREAFLTFQLDAIDQLGPKPGEMDELELEWNRLRHSGKSCPQTTRHVSSRLDQGEDALCD